MQLQWSQFLHYPIGSSDNGCTSYWSPGLLHTLGAGAHIKLIGPWQVSKIAYKNDFQMQIWASLSDDFPGVEANVPKSTMVQVTAWCRQATSHNLDHCWPRSMSPYDVTRGKWVNKGLCGLKWFALNIFCEDHLQPCLCLMLQIN